MDLALDGSGPSSLLSLLFSLYGEEIIIVAITETVADKSTKVLFLFKKKPLITNGNNLYGGA